MQRISLLFALFTAQLLSSQISFERIFPPPPAPQIIADFEWLIESSVAFSDVDGDGDEDFLVTGYTGNVEIISKLYANDGFGGFTEVMGTPFEEVAEGSIAFSDVDNDGDEDLLITGKNDSGQPISKLYLNDGSGLFTEFVGVPFDGVSFSSIAFSDIDNDGDEDVLITGSNNTGQPISKLYANDGAGVFSELIGTPFDGVLRGSIAFSDADNDGDEDVLITGEGDLGLIISKLYANNGLGVFTEVTGTPFMGVRNGSVAFSDIDNDGDEDVLITGENSSSQHISKLYTNDGLGVFTEVTATPFEGVIFSMVAFSDVDNDGDADVLIAGANSSFQTSSKLYSNDGSGVFTEVMGTSFEEVGLGSLVFSDVDNDGDEDIFMGGFLGSFMQSSRLYINDGSGFFTKVTGSPFDGVLRGSIAFSDVDNDGDEDVLITGYNVPNRRISKLYINDGLGVFTELTGTAIEAVMRSSIAFSDVDNDGDEDLLITGENSSDQDISKLYINDGLGFFSEVTGTPFMGVRNGSVAFSDIDNDGDEDVLITGRNSSNNPVAKLYTNNGSGVFTEVIAAPFEAVDYSSVAFSDVDNDGDEDVLITGMNSASQHTSKLYTNDGLGNFTEVLGTSFQGVVYGCVAFSDVDNDGDGDLLITGENGAGQYISKLYTNDGLGVFTEITGTPFEGVRDSFIAFSDVDNDGDEDVLITGKNSSSQPISKLYTNNGLGVFVELSGTPFDSVLSGSLAFSDIDNDGYSDVLITGRNRIDQGISRAFRNTTCFSVTFGTDIQIACDSYTWIDGNTYSASNNTATHTLTNAAGCDSIVTLDLTINNSSFGTDVQMACNSYTWMDGITYTSSNNTATYTLTNVVGCDSIITLDLTINSSTGTDVHTACDSYTWIDGNTYTSSNNTATHTLVNAAGCDSIVTLDLTINNSTTGTDVQTACDSYTWIDGNTYTASNNSATHTLTNAAGCDSIVTLDLTINNSTTGTDVQTACDSYTWIDGNTYTSSNNTATFTIAGGNTVGCDSIVTLDLTINNSTTGTDVQTACDSYTWIDGNTYTASNNTATFTIAGGNAV
ncbi:FG-GAP repeat domain-containing protein, partial [Brumimicrobium oceani]|uniref:FG-GAP repeat domain-containing protein n=1 Tax=Brumimicrobium oceani TaxID=2100725 RepID=UPI0018EEB1CA